MHKLRGRATLLVLVLGFVWPSLSEAKTHHKSARKAGHPPAKRLHPTHPTLRTGGKAGQVSVSNRNGGKTRRPGRIRQDTDNKIVLEWIEASHPPAVYGPFLPPGELYDFPQAPLPSCEPFDVILEAHVHDESAEAPEAQAAEEPSDPSRIAGLLSVAKRIGSFFRPKSASARVTPEDVDLANLLSARLRIPVEGADVEKLRDSFLDRRGRYRKHLAIDIGAPRGTPVVATTDGEIVRLTRERRGGISIYQKDVTGRYLFFYCHLARYAPGLEAGQQVRAGEVIGYVGATGHVVGGPHLHFSITRVPEGDDFREGLAINPYLLFLAGVP